MDWDQLFLEKENWQRETFERLKNALVSVRGNRFVYYDHADETHLVMIYGKSQVGKTTLILNMIGLKSEHFNEVYETLRAGIPRGNSSTSTAIIYSRSNNENYGCALVSGNSLSPVDIAYFDETGMIQHLRQIRQEAESNRISPDDILYIYIPGSYFIEDSNIRRISILDMPGIESSNHREDIHVQNLMTKYVPVSSVCIIACQSDDIQSLEKTDLPNRIDWKRMEHRFVLVITHAYSDGTIKRYFKTKRAERKDGFYEYVKRIYTQEIRNILGAQNQTEVYPVDVGESLSRLCTEEIKNDEDQQEIIAVKDRMLADLRGSIVERKGERLKSALMDLESIIEHFGENQIHEIALDLKKCSDKIAHKKLRIQRAERNIESLQNEDRWTIKEEIAVLISVGVQLQRMSYYVTSLPEQVEQTISSQVLFKRGAKGAYLKDKKKAVLNCIRSHITEQIEEFVRKLTSLKDQAEITMDINLSEIIDKAESECVFAEQERLYPRKTRLLSKKEKVLLEEVKIICVDIQVNTNHLLDTYRSACAKKIKEKIQEKQEIISSMDSLEFKEEKKIRRFQNDITTLEQHIADLEQRRDEIEKKRKRDQDTLAMYLDYANRSYEKQRSDIIKRINQSPSPDDKMLLILLLGLLDKDYTKVTGGINERNHKEAVKKSSQGSAE